MAAVGVEDVGAEQEDEEMEENEDGEEKEEERVEWLYTAALQSLSALKGSIVMGMV